MHDNAQHNILLIRHLPKFPKGELGFVNILLESGLAMRPMTKWRFEEFQRSGSVGQPFTMKPPIPLAQSRVSNSFCSILPGEQHLLTLKPWKS